MKKITILAILILLIFGVGITYSLLHSSANLAINDQNIAKFVFNAESTDQIQLPLLDMKPGDKKDYLFSVRNNENGNKSDVAIEYVIAIKTYHFIPFTINLYKVDNETFIDECSENKFPRNAQNELVCNMPAQEMDFDSESIDNYRLEIEFSSEYSDVSYSELVDFINLEIKSWQKI